MIQSRLTAPPNPHRKIPDLIEIQKTIAVEHSLRLARLVDMLSLLQDMLVDDMPEHPEAEHIRAISFAAIDVARIAETGVDKLVAMLSKTGGAA